MTTSAMDTDDNRAPGHGTPGRRTPGGRGPWPAGRRAIAGLRHKRRPAPVIAARVAILLGLVSFIDPLLPHAHRHTFAFVPLASEPARATATAFVVVAGLVLLRVAAGLRKRRRAAWRTAVLACVVVASADLVRAERRPVEAAITIALLIGLVASRRSFTARSDPHGPWFAVRLCVQSVAVAITYGLLMLGIGSHVPPNTSFWACLGEIVSSLAGLGGDLALHGDRFADVFHATLLIWGLLTAVWAIVLVLRGSEPHAALTDADEHRLRGLLDREGERDSLGYFALRRDKSVVWSASGKAAITYRVVAGVALVSGDPIGDPEAWPGAIAAYRELVESYGWTPAAMGCSELGAIVLRRDLGLTALNLGDEAVLDAGTFALSGRAMRGVRQACVRVERAGYSVQVRRVRDVGETELADLQRAASAWRVDPIERGYSMALSRLGDPSDGDCLVVTARQDGHLRGILHFVPWGTAGISLDLMRRDRESDNGLNEHMIATVMQACPGLGIERVSLNFAVFRDALERGARIGAGPVLRLWRRVLLIASRWWQIDSLYRFNEKFHPQWRARYISYPGARDIPRVALAALEAEAFVVPPRLLTALSGRRPA